MSRRKQRKLDTAIAAIQKQHGPQAIRRGMPAKRATAVPHVTTGFPELDAITGCKGIPLGAMTLVSGRITSGKLTLAYKALAGAQGYRSGDTVAILDLAHSTDVDYLARCGADLQRLLLVRPQPGVDLPGLLVDLVRSGDIRMILFDSLDDLLADTRTVRRLHSLLGMLNQTLRAQECSLIVVHESERPWQRWPATRWLFGRSRPIQQQAALCIEMQHERWLRSDGTLFGYRARACVARSRWRYDRPCAPVEIRFNGTVRARSTW